MGNIAKIMNEQIRGFKRISKEEISLNLEQLEISLLNSLLEQLITLLKPIENQKNTDPLASIVNIDSEARKPDDEVLLRLLPDAYKEDSESSQEFRRFTERSLRLTKIERADLVLKQLPLENESTFIKQKDFEKWLTVLNDLRLALGTRIGISEEDTDDDFDEEDHAQEIYSWLTWLQSNLLEEISK